MVEVPYLDSEFARTCIAETTRHAELQGIPLQQLAAERGVDAFDLMMDLALDDDLATRFRILQDARYEERRALVTDPRTVFGVHDAGAHVDSICDACFPTYTLRYWVREHHAMTLEQAVWRLSGQPAEIFGIPDRGFIKPGSLADLVAFDPDAVSETALERVYDLPANGERVIARSEGIEHIWVAGTSTRRAGRDVEGATPGSFLSAT